VTIGKFLPDEDNWILHRHLPTAGFAPMNGKGGTSNALF
jgi:hypothetical protein